MPDFDRSPRRRYAASDGGGAELRPSQRLPQRPGQRPESREPRFDQRLDQWLATGRQLVDGVAGARPGSRASGRPQPGGRAGGRPRPGGLGRWVEDTLEWLREDDDGWRESWEEPAPGSRGRSSEQAWGPSGAWSGSAGWSSAAAEPADFRDSSWAQGPAGAAFNPAPEPDPWAPPSSRPTRGQGSTNPSPSPASNPTGGPGSGAAAPPQAPMDWRQDFSAPGQTAVRQAPQVQPTQRRPLEALSRRATPLLPPRSPGPEAQELAGDWSQEWPDDASFTVARWQRPAGPDPQAQAPLPLQPLLRPPGPGPGHASDPVDQADQSWLGRPGPGAQEGAPPANAPAAGPGRPVPRSTRRRPGA